MPIHLLSPETIGQIAAGEVVERPAAAIKELVENSLDAGATAVTVEIRDGGISYFRVTDNGSGIRSNEIRLAFERHATSKIVDQDDLHAIATLGFRGEALASIAAVARVTCTTRTAEDESGIKLMNEGGSVTALEEAACPQGTTMVVRDLFYNTPVRLKFLKKPAAEASLVTDLMMRLILSRPDVSFRYIQQGKTVYHSAGDGKLASAVFSIYGMDMTRNMRSISGHGAGLVVEGYVGIGDGARGNRTHESFFINGRYTRSNLLSAAVEEGCRERVMIGKFPTCVLHITMPYELVDVNVHPNKLEVRFQNERAIGDAVADIVREWIADRDALQRPNVMTLTPDPPITTPVQVLSSSKLPAPEPVLQEAKNPPAVASTENDKQSAAPSYTPPVIWDRPLQQPAMLRTQDDAAATYTASLRQPEPVQTETMPQTAKPEQAVQLEASSLPPVVKPLRLIGVVFETFILIEYDDHLLMIDQHAVHERLLFDELYEAWSKQSAAQELLVPLVVSITAREMALIEQHQEELAALGLTLEPFGQQEVQIRSVPMVLGQPQAESFLKEVLDELMSERGNITMEKRRAAILQIACKKAVKGGDHLSEAQIRDLVERMMEQKVTPTCPHGRPLVIALSHQELEKRFHRIQ